MKSDWETVTLGSVVEIASGQVDPRENPYCDMIHVGGDNIKSHTGGLQNLRTAGEQRLISGKYQFDRRDVLYSKIRPALNKVVAPDFEGICSADIYPLRPINGKLCKEFLVHLLRSDDFLEYTKTCSSRTNIPKINRNALFAYQALLPPLQEQRRLATILDKANAIRQKREEGTRLTEALLRSAFLEMFGDPVRNERGWPVVKVREAGDVQLGRQRAPKYQTGNHTRPYIRVANVFEDRIDLSDHLSMDFNASDFTTFRLRHGDILLNEGQSTELVGRPAMWRDELPLCCFQNTLVRFRSNTKMTVPEFALEVFLYYLRKGQFARISSKTSSVAHLGAGRFAEMPFPLPPLETQHEYATRRQRAYEALKQRRKQLQESKLLFSSLVQRAFRGEL